MKRAIIGPDESDSTAEPTYIASMVNETEVAPEIGIRTDDLLRLAAMAMPYGKYKGVILVDLPERYVVWIANNAMPKGELGRLLELLYEIKLNGLEYLLAPLKNPPQHS